MVIGPRFYCALQRHMGEVGESCADRRDVCFIRIYVRTDNTCITLSCCRRYSGVRAGANSPRFGARHLRFKYTIDIHGSVINVWRGTRQESI